MSDTVEPLTDDAWDADRDAPDVPHVDWRHDPTLRSMAARERAPSTPKPTGGTEPTTVVLLDGRPTAMALTRAQAIEAGHPVLDVDAPTEHSAPDMLAPAAPGPESVVDSMRPVLQIVSSSDTDRERMNEWLRTVSRSRGVREVGPPPIRRLSVVRTTPDAVAEYPPAPDTAPPPPTTISVAPPVLTPTVPVTVSSAVPVIASAVPAIASPDVALTASTVVHVVAAPPLLDPLAGEVRVPLLPDVASAQTVVPVLVPKPVEAQTAPPVSETVSLRVKLAASAPVLVAVRALTKVVRRREASKELFRSVSIDLHAGEFVAVTGPSGSGKSMLLSCLSGTLRPDAGDVLIEGHEIGSMTEADSARQRSSLMGFTSMTPGLVSILTAVENVELPLLVAGWKAADARTEALAALALLRLSDVPACLPESLSTGERVRVCIARGLVGDPKVLWADDPTGGLDPDTADDVAHVFRQLSDDGLTVVVVSHDVALLQHAHRIMELRDGAFRELSRRKVLEACQRRLR